MDELGLTIRGVADYVGVTHTTVQRWLQKGMCHARFELVNVRPLARLLGLTPDELLEAAERIRKP